MHSLPGTLAAGCIIAVAALHLAPSSLPHIIVERNLPLKLKDGVTLYADVYRPEAEGKYPALLMRTPYDKDGAQQSARLAMTVAAVRRGYVVVVQDTRGQFKSEGRFIPYAQEIADGYETIEWVARLPSVDGQVGMFGLSYPGAVQWMTAPTRPPHLRAIAPAMTFAHPNHFFYHGGIFEADFIEWLLPRQSRERQQLRLPYASSDQISEVWTQHGDAWMDHRPLADLPLMRDFGYWKDWVANAIESDYWRPYDIESQHHLVQVPALNLSGWNDDPYGQPGAIRNFIGMRANGGTDAARRGQRLVMGPWTHGVPSLSRSTYAGTDFGPNSAFDFVEAQLRFFDYWLKGKDEGFSNEAPVRIFVMGENRWRDEQEWPIARSIHQSWYLNGGQLLTRTETAAAGRTEFVYDPRNPARVPLPTPSGAANWSAVTARNDVVEFTSPPLTSPIEITGHIVARLWFSSSAPDTDVTVRLLAARPDGFAYALTNAYGALRTRYRSTEEPLPPRPLPPGEPSELTISVGYTSIVVPTGHRLQLVVAGSMRQGLTIHPNTWDFASRSTKPVVAMHAIHHTPEHRSRILIPTIPRR
jgi:putative CocE/NonD family hydrolase